MKHIKEELLEPINLISEVTNILTELNHPNPTLWQHTLLKVENNAFNISDLHTQRIIINEVFRLILGQCYTENTMDIRYALIPNGTHRQWVELFRSYIAPNLIRLNLPK